MLKYTSSLCFKSLYLHFYCNHRNETSILVAVRFSMKYIYMYQSCDLGHAVGQNNVDISQ